MNRVQRQAFSSKHTVDNQPLRIITALPRTSCTADAIDLVQELPNVRYSTGSSRRLRASARETVVKLLSTDQEEQQDGALRPRTVFRVLRTPIPAGQVMSKTQEMTGRVEAKCYVNTLRRNQRRKGIPAVNVDFLPPCRVPISALLALLPQSVTTPVVFDIKLKDGPPFTAVYEDGYFYKLRKSLMSLNNSDLSRPRSLIVHKEDDQEDEDEAGVPVLLKNVFEERISPADVVAARGPFLRGLGDANSANNAKSAFSVYTRSGKLDPSVTAFSCPPEDLKRGIPYNQFFQNTTRLVREPKNGVSDLQIDNEKRADCRVSCQSEQPFFLRLKLADGENYDYFCNIKIHDDPLVAAYVRAHDAPYDVTNLRIGESSRRDDEDNEDDDYAVSRHTVDALLTLQSYMDRRHFYKKWTVTRESATSGVVKAAGGQYAVRVMATRDALQEIDGEYGVVWSLMASYIYDPQEDAIVGVRSSVRSKPPAKYKEFPPEKTRKFYLSGDVVRVATESKGSSPDGFVVCRKFPGTMRLPGMTCSEMGFCYFAQNPSLAIQVHIERAEAQVNKWRDEGVSRRQQRPERETFWQDWWDRLMILIALLPSATPLRISIDPSFVSPECHKAAVDAVVAMDDCCREAAMVDTRNKVVDPLPSAGLVELFQHTRPPENETERRMLEDNELRAIRELFRNRLRPRFRDRRLEAMVNRQVAQF